MEHVAPAFAALLAVTYVAGTLGELILALTERKKMTAVFVSTKLPMETVKSVCKDCAVTELEPGLYEVIVPASDAIATVEKWFEGTGTVV